MVSEVSTEAEDAVGDAAFEVSEPDADGPEAAVGDAFPFLRCAAISADSGASLTFMNCNRSPNVRIGSLPSIIFLVIGGSGFAGGLGRY